MSKKIKTLIFIVAILVFLFTTNFSAFAQNLLLDPTTESKLQEQEQDFISSAGLGTQRPSVMISYVIKAVLGLLGVIFITLTIYAGLSWMTSAGNEEKISKAKNTIAAAIIGLAIVLAGYLITFYIIDKILFATGASRAGLF